MQINEDAQLKNKQKPPTPQTKINPTYKPQIKIH